MDDVRNRLDQALRATVSRLRHPGGAATTEELTWTGRARGHFADEIDGIQASESREVELATCELLVERVHRLSAALDRMREGAYGICVECDDVISAARLRATPEAQTCVRCQDRIERAGRRPAWSRRDVLTAGEDAAMAATSLVSGGASYLPSEGDREVRVPGTLRAAASF
jgi:DnaK suppressor protein